MFAILAFETPDLQAEPYEQAYVNFPKALKCVSNYRRLSILNFNIFFFPKGHVVMILLRFHNASCRDRQP